MKSTNDTPLYISSQHERQRTMPLGSGLAPLLHCRLQTNLLLGATFPAAGQPSQCLRAETYSMAHADMQSKRTYYSMLFMVSSKIALYKSCSHNCSAETTNFWQLGRHLGSSAYLGPCSGPQCSNWTLRSCRATGRPAQAPASLAPAMQESACHASWGQHGSLLLIRSCLFVLLFCGISLFI